MALPRWLLVPLSLLDKILLLLVVVNDKLMYSPLQKHLTPLIKKIPRDVVLCGKKQTLLTANRVTYSRTCLLIVIAACLKYDYNWLACACVLLNDLLDHVDGIVAKAQRQIYGNIDSPLLGAFVDAFCDKVVNVSVLWTMLLLTNLCTFSLPQFVAFVGVASGVICMECVLGVVRVQDYYKEKYTGSDATPTAGIRANMEGKTKEKLENIGLSLLCVAMASRNPMDTWCGWIGILSLGLSLRFAVGSLLHKLRSRRAVVKKVAVNGHISKVDDNVFEGASYGCDYTSKSHNVHFLRTLSVPALKNSQSSDDLDEESEQGQQHIPPDSGNEKVDKVYTVGCFDLFHRGHRKLLKNMRNLGREVIVGIHNDESYYKLKKKDPIDTVEKRMANVKNFAHQVFVISSTDPSPYLTCCIHLNPGQTALYVRGDDMPRFPGRNVIEPLMPIQLLPYTQGVSSTQLRAELLDRGEGDGTDKLKAL